MIHWYGKSSRSSPPIFSSKSLIAGFNSSRRSQDEPRQNWQHPKLPKPDKVGNELTATWRTISFTLIPKNGGCGRGYSSPFICICFARAPSIESHLGEACFRPSMSSTKVLLRDEIIPSIVFCLCELMQYVWFVSFARLEDERNTNYSVPYGKSKGRNQFLALFASS